MKKEEYYGYLEHASDWPFFIDRIFSTESDLSGNKANKR